MLWIFCFSLFLLTSADARLSCPNVTLVSRDEWGARAPTSITNLTGEPLSFYVIHHTYQPASCYDDASCIQRVQSIQRFHQDDRGWSDIGYHFLVGENGKVYEGRGWNRESAHSSGWNQNSFGICIIGDFTVSPPNQKAIDTVTAWINCGIDIGRVRRNYYVITHRQSQRPGYTECPGTAAFERIQQWPRFCSFQNPGLNTTADRPITSVAEQFCRDEIKFNQANSHRLVVPWILPLLFSLFFF